jgi:hypothetical protein
MDPDLIKLASRLGPSHGLLIVGGAFTKRNATFAALFPVVAAAQAAEDQLAAAESTRITLPLPRLPTDPMVEIKLDGTIIFNDRLSQLLAPVSGDAP